MGDSRYFIHFSHPGREHEPDRGGVEAWNQSSLSHKRSIMQFRGEWIESEGRRCTGDLAAWGEWEPESELIWKLQQPGGDLQHPRYLWQPFYVQMGDYFGATQR